MKPFETLALRRLQKLVNKETEEARTKYQNDLSDHDPSVAVVVLVEDSGKVARSVNKIGMATDDSIARQWRDEQNKRIVTSISILQRMYLGAPSHAD